VRPLAAVVFFPFDEVLRGMLAAGQGTEALCLFLGLSRASLDDHLVRLDLATPHDRPLRKPGARGWTVLESICVIWWRGIGVHPEIIGKRLGRTAGAVRSKCRRLGMRAPARNLLHKPDPNSLRDPSPGCFWPNAAQKSAEASAAPATPTAVCGRVAGVTSFRGSDPEKTFERGKSPATGAKIYGMFGGSIGQRELPLFGVVGGKDRQGVNDAMAQVDRNVAKLAHPIHELVVPKTFEEVDFSGDLRWIGKTRRPLMNKVAVWICGMLYLGGLHWTEAAKRVGMSSSAFRTFKTRAGIPVELNRKRFSEVFDEPAARATLAASGLKLRQCLSAVDGNGNWFWVERSDFGTRLSPPKRKRDHDIEGRFNRVKILKGPEIIEGQTQIFAPFANEDGNNRRGSHLRSPAYA
jgi:hypothetical protein